ncbi:MULTISPECIES: hypothetical protein [Bacillus amyloliquefaciens group]|nr:MULTISPECIES: hypothetical protein [Bacillus amyloliquefaciens group]QKP74875.1 hypothetical protein HT132_14585 [Bacillus amyloliquefaciens]UGW85840.1 hypothetical protein LT232_06895 [Bacillus velezensis]
MSVEFVRKDENDQFIVPLTIRIAQHYSETRESKAYFIKIIRTKWDFSDDFKKLKLIIKKFSSFEDGDEINSIFEQIFSFSGCNDEVTVNKIRGALAEGVLLGTYGKSIINAKSFGWGANVNLLSDNKLNAWKIKYSCPKHCDSNFSDCYSRETIDLGIWDGDCGEFFECKTRPSSIGCPEINYMKELDKALNKKKIEHKLYFATTDTVENTRLSLAKKFPSEHFYEVISLQDSIA